MHKNLQQFKHLTTWGFEQRRSSLGTFMCAARIRSFYLDRGLRRRFSCGAALRRGTTLTMRSCFVSHLTRFACSDTCLAREGRCTSSACVPASLTSTCRPLGGDICGHAQALDRPTPELYCLFSCGSCVLYIRVIDVKRGWPGFCKTQKWQCGRRIKDSRHGCGSSSEGS
jgi:hypothetical protein